MRPQDRRAGRPAFRPAAAYRRPTIRGTEADATERAADESYDLVDPEFDAVDVADLLRDLAGPGGGGAAGADAW